MIVAIIIIIVIIIVVVVIIIIIIIIILLLFCWLSSFFLSFFSGWSSTEGVDSHPACHTCRCIFRNTGSKVACPLAYFGRHS